MFSLKGLDKRLHDGNNSKKKKKKKLVYIDIRVNSLYKDMIMIQGTPLETPPIPLSGHVVCSVSGRIRIKRIKLRLVCHYKLDFIQMVHDDMASIVKERTKILECTWNNLLNDPEAETHYDFIKVRKNNKKMNGIFRGITKWNSNDYSDTIPLSTSKPNDVNSSGSDHGKWYEAGNYEFPFHVQLPNDIPETIEGLQSGSILYNFILDIETDERNNKVDVSNKYHFFKYLRIFRTLSLNHIAIQEEMMVTNKIRNMLEYEIYIPSRAVPIGEDSTIDLKIKLMPFEKKYYKLDAIIVGLVQEYCVKDRHDEEYVDNSVIESMHITTFDDMNGITSGTNELIDFTSLEFNYEMPKDLKSITQDCDIIIGKGKKNIMYVRHELSVRIKMIKLKDGCKPMEIKTRLPLLLYVSPMKKLMGRRVYFNQATGNIHFRANDYVPLFHAQEHTAGGDALYGTAAVPGLIVSNTYGTAVAPPPLYNEIDQDQVYMDNMESQLIFESTAAELPVTHQPLANNGEGNPKVSTPSYEEAETNIHIPEPAPKYE
ncbi:Art5p RNJ42_01531 [Nakaseomyces bracarensis]|uniref:Art5p n=1 Tax=Nakaseomyces bracarensis TaxID=273131 RepID=UPI003871FFE7